MESELDVSDEEVLTVDKILSIVGKTDPSDVLKLNAFALGVTTIHNLDLFDKLEIVSLSLNKIVTLHQFAKCKQLRELHLRKNRITDLAEVAHLSSLPHLHTLLLSDNPCCNAVKYRLKVVRTVKHLRKLDSRVITDEEFLDSSCSDDADLTSFDAVVSDKVLDRQRDDNDAATTIEKIKAGHRTNDPSSPHTHSNILLAAKLLLLDMSRAETNQLMVWCAERLDDDPT